MDLKIKNGMFELKKPGELLSLHLSGNVCSC